MEIKDRETKYKRNLDYLPEAIRDATALLLFAIATALGFSIILSVIYIIRCLFSEFSSGSYRVYFSLQDYLYFSADILEWWPAIWIGSILMLWWIGWSIGKLLLIRALKQLINGDGNPGGPGGPTLTSKLLFDHIRNYLIVAVIIASAVTVGFHGNSFSPIIIIAFALLFYGFALILINLLSARKAAQPWLENAKNELFSNEHHSKLAALVWAYNLPYFATDITLAVFPIIAIIRSVSIIIS